MKSQEPTYFSLTLTNACCLAESMCGLLAKPFHLLLERKIVESLPLLMLLAPVSWRNCVRSRVDELGRQTQFNDSVRDHYASTRVRHERFRGRALPTAFMRIVSPAFQNGRAEQ